jgi:hypothetical protein
VVRLILRLVGCLKDEILIGQHEPTSENDGPDMKIHEPTFKMNGPTSIIDGPARLSMDQPSTLIPIHPPNHSSTLHPLTIAL